MNKYTKKPITVEAVQFLNKITAMDNRQRVEEFFGDFTRWRVSGNGDSLFIETLEGEMRADNGDWIIKEPNPTDDRRFYPCKPDIFQATYSPALLTPEAVATNMKLSIKQLETLAERINKRWPKLWTAVTSLESGYLAVSHLGPPYEEQVEWVQGNSDLSNADWIVWCMERLEELAYNTAHLADAKACSANKADILACHLLEALA